MNETRSIGREDFPPLLKEITDPPKKLYIKGADIDVSNKFLCVVGSRKYTPYGKEVCEFLIEGLRGLPIVIVSGLALGIDSIAHRTALSSGLKTIAVPGSGLDESVLYPASHVGLSREILKSGGSLISELEPKVGAATWTFPQRNRVMAGLSNAILVIEAEIKSGTLITARLAMEYNRDVYATPGPIFSKNSEGPHYLIRNGATPITKPEDIIEALGLEKEEKLLIEKDYSSCSEKEMTIIRLLSEPKSRDKIMEISPLLPSETNATLSLLEIKGLIVERGGLIEKK